MTVYCSWVTNHLWLDRACMARGDTDTKPVGPGFVGSDPALDLEGGQLGHEQDGMNQEK